MTKDNIYPMISIGREFGKHRSEFDDGIIPVNVNLSVTVIDVLSILEKDLQFMLKFRLFMNWYDYRLSYHNLKKSKLLNSLSRNEVEQIWIPFIIFSNTENSEFTEGNKESEIASMVSHLK